MNPHHLFRIILTAILLSVIVFPLEIQADPLVNEAESEEQKAYPNNKRPAGYWYPPYRMRKVRAAGISPELIEKVITIRYLHDMTQCFEAAIAETPDMQGKLMLSLIMNSGGKVTQAKVIQSSMNNAPLEACLVDAALHWTFWTMPYQRGNPDGFARADIRLEYPR
ncbi:MAG: AgmX/PglI C-terminal domain-containing protein [Proteobacteria bacterium]|nr:AgmX/PglI C-terminal domain-containing protein [Pseudomonadota bacterium]